MVGFFKKHWVWFLILTLLVFVAYGNSLTNDFVSDDIGSIPGNPALQSINYIFNNPTFFARTIPYYLAFKIGGANPIFFRLINIFFHLGNVWLLYVIFNFLSEKRIALLAAAIFAVHPILIESVSWISGGVYSQYTFFLLLSFLLYVRYKHKLTRYSFSLLAFLFALSTSEKAAVLPLIIVAYEFYPPAGGLRKHWKQVIPYFLMVGVWVFILFSTRLTERVTFLQSQFHMDKGVDNPIFQVPIAIISYLRILFFPLTLSFYHTELQFTYVRYFIYLVFFLVYAACAVIAYKKSKLVFFWLVFFFISLLPTLTPFRISWIVAERYAYPAAIGIIFAFSYLLVRLARSEIAKNAVVVFSVLLITALAARTILRNIDWKNQDNLWIATIKTSPSSPVSHNNMADVYSRRGDLKNAERELLTALQLNPNYADAYHNLANIYKDSKKPDKALELYKKAASLNPALWQSYVNIASLYFEKKDFAKALEFNQKALKIDPYNGVLYRNLGIIYLNMKEKDKALEVLYKSLSFKPDDQLTKALIIEASK